MSKNKIYLSKEVTFDDDILARVTDAIDKTMSYLLDDEGYSVNLVITDDEEIREINREQREIDRSTDVLSFPIWNTIPIPLITMQIPPPTALTRVTPRNCLTG